MGTSSSSKINGNTDNKPSVYTTLRNAVNNKFLKQPSAESTKPTRSALADRQTNADDDDDDDDDETEGRPHEKRIAGGFTFSEHHGKDTYSRRINLVIDQILPTVRSVILKKWVTFNSRRLYIYLQLLDTDNL